jgi:multicomponent Na+:H+ antiporter subunit B
VTEVFSAFLLTLLVITAVAAVRARNLFVSVMLTGIYSLLIAINFFLLDAADVALTEAAVGAGVATVFFLGALSLTAEQERSPSAYRPIGIGIFIAVTLVLVYATLGMPAYGDPDAPVHVHVAPWYLEMTPEYIDIPNIVTAVLGSYRGYDTLGEVFVVFTAGIGVMFILGVRPPRRTEGTASLTGREDGLRHYLIPRVVGRLFIPFVLLFGLYVQFHGEYSPGGGFQAGAIIASSIILYALLEGEDRALQVIPRRVLNGLTAGGALLYGSVGIAGMLAGGNFLDYSVLASDPVKGQQMGLLIIEAGVGITVTGVLLTIFHAFAARGRP